MKLCCVTLVLISLLAGCWHEKAKPREKVMAAAQSEWKQGDVVELTGKIHPARTDARYFLETADGRGVSIRSGEIDKLAAGTELWVKGTIEYVHYPKPKDYREEKVGQDKVSASHGVAFPLTVCYINVSEYKILTPQPPAQGDRAKRAAP